MVSNAPVSHFSLSLISISIACSVLLTVLSTARNGVVSPLKYPNVQLAVGFFVFLACFACGIVGLSLTWTNTISVEVFGVTIIGLIPAFQALVDLFPTMFAQAAMGRKRSLQPSSKAFRYVRYDRAVVTDADGNPTVTNDEICYIRLEATHNRPRNTSPENQVWYGYVVDERTDSEGHLRAAMLCDMANGKNFLWWRAIVGASRVVARPHSIGLNSQATAVTALSVLADIVIVGDLLLQHHGDFLATIFNENMNDFSDPNRASPDLSQKENYFERMRLRSLRHRVETCTVVCNLIFNQLSLDGWGPIDINFSRFPVGSTAVRARKYAAIFFMACIESQLFLNHTRKWSGPDIVNLIWSQDPSIVADATSEWLKELGFSPPASRYMRTPLKNLKESADSKPVRRPSPIQVLVHEGGTIDLPPSSHLMDSKINGDAV